MRRDFRKKTNNNLLGDKILMYSCIGVAVLAVIVFGLLMYSRSLNEDVKNSQLNSEQIASIIGNDTNSESTSSSIGRSIEEQEAKQNLTNSTSENGLNTTSNTNSNNSKNESNSSTNASSSNNTANSINNNNNNSSNTQTTQPTAANAQDTKKKELSFEKPVEGEITKEFAKENLIYSETLQEWVTHTGIDIKADKTTVVKSAEEGTVKSIKNDPRYGLTVVIEHDDGFQTVYSNLLTAEFVSEGEKVTKGQTIGTVGNTAAFEIADEAHLHFEILKDSIQVDPAIYLK